LADNDVVSLVTYDEHVQTVAARYPGARRQELVSRIQAIRTGGTTNLSGGWLRGRELVAEGIQPHDKSGPNAGNPAPASSPDPEYDPDTEAAAIRRVLLLTDGLANVGITDHGALEDLAASGAAAGVGTSTIGFGQGYDERLLRAMAEAGGGSTYYIETPDQAPAVFEAEIEGLMALAAQNLAVTVAPADAVDAATVHHQYPSQQTDDGALRLELGDLYASEPKTLLVEFLLLSDDAGDPADVATLTLEGHALLPGGGVEKRTITLPITVSREHGAVVNPEVRRELLLQEAARARDEALDDRAHGRFDDGARKLREVARKLAPRAPDDAEIQDELDDLRDLADRFDAEQVSEADAKYMAQRAYSLGSSKRAAMDALRADRAEDRKRRGR
ncbi:MAG TPA: hypothetical protein VLL48_04500, partial [Longimicrobiales bacterium]|nr:hypothetical protein [Longimicrobiales bacterium]